MRTLLCLSLVCVAACGSSTSTTGNGNNTGATYSLLITNTASWCNVTATLNGNQLVNFQDANATIQAQAGATIDLDATPLPTFQAAQWTGTTSTTSPTTYVMTTDSNQNVSVYCP